MPAAKSWSGWQALKDHPWLTALVIFLPPLSALLFIAIFASGTPHKLPVGVVDLDHTSESRLLIRKLDAHPSLDMRHPFTSATEGADALHRGEVYALLIIPSDFGKDLRRSTSPKTSAFYNSQYLLAGKFISSALMQTSMSFSAEIGVALRLGQGYSLPEAISAAAPVQPQITALYNAGMSYALFLVTSITPAVWQILIVASTLLALCWRLERAPLSNNYASRVSEILQLLLPIALILWLQGILFLAFYYLFLGWSPEDNVLWIVLAMALKVLAIQSVGTLILSLVGNKISAFSLSSAYLAPAFAFMGMTFPRGDMNSLAQFWGNLMPSTHFMELQVAVADHGAPLLTFLPSLGWLAVFSLLLPFAIYRLPSQLEVNMKERISL